MSGKSVTVRRLGTILKPDQSRVLLRPFNMPADPVDPLRNPYNRAVGPKGMKVIARIMALSEQEVSVLLGEVLAEFAGRHRQIRELLLERYGEVRHLLLTDREPSEERKLLIGSYFISEYAMESAALFNPSIVPHPDQSGLPPGSLRFVLSLRATGEGHISSITFRSGIIRPDLGIELDPPTRFVTEPAPLPNAYYDKPLFERKLRELRLADEFARRVLARLDDAFTIEQLRSAIDDALMEARTRAQELAVEETARGIWLLARSNYEVQFQPGQELSERVIFPANPSQANGIEDARFVLFREDDGSGTYYATYTAFDGRLIIPQLLETGDFLHFRFITLNGPAIENKGLALFPRRIGGCYAMLSRQDNENIHLMFSDNIHFWYESKIIVKPTFPWEFVQLGNCGSPIETEAGWLVLSHGVGPMRRYCIGAFLLDRDDPSKVLGRLPEPLLKPETGEREGYVPNVVYSCGSLVHNGTLVLPYAMSDYATRFALVPLDELLAAMI